MSSFAKPSTRLRFPCLLLLATFAFTAVRCTSPAQTGDDGEPYRTIRVEPRRDTELARKLNQEGLVHLQRAELQDAHESFTQALAADVEFGPAHNNLGKVYFRQSDWYKAAWEFEYARKLMPKHAQPCNNLGLVLEQAGELDRAVDQYRQAVTFDNSVEFQGNLARALIRRGERTKEVRLLLSDIIERDTRPDWVLWARQQQASFPKE